MQQCIRQAEIAREDNSRTLAPWDGAQVTAEATEVFGKLKASKPQTHNTCSCVMDGSSTCRMHEQQRSTKSALMCWKNSYNKGGEQSSASSLGWCVRDGSRTCRRIEQQRSSRGALVCPPAAAACTKNSKPTAYTHYQCCTFWLSLARLAESWLYTARCSYAVSIKGICLVCCSATSGQLAA